MSDERQRDAAPSDPRILAAWRAASSEEPSAEVDAAIFAAARSAVRQAAPAGPSPAWATRWHGWQPLAAAAGVAGLAFVLAQVLPRDEPLQPRPTPPATTVETAATPAPAPAAREPGPPPAPASIPERSREADTVRPPAASASAAPPPPVEPAAKARQEAVAPAAMGGAVAGNAMESNAMESKDAASAQSEASEAPASPARGALLQGLVAPDPVDRWVDRIASRYAAGDLAAAAADLRAFRAAYPDADAHLPESLRAWATTVTPAEAP